MKYPARFHLPALLLCALLAGCQSELNLSPAELVQRAATAQAGGDYQAAILDLKAALQEEPNNLSARLALGKIYLALGDGPSARKEIEFVRRLQPENLDLSPLLAKALLLEEKYGEVLDIELPTTLSDVQRAEMMAARALAYLERESLARARRSVESAVTLAPDAPYPQYAAVRMAEADGDRERALALLEGLLADNPEYGAGWSLAGDLYVMDGQLQQALEAYTRVVDLNVASSRDYLRRGMARLSLGDIAGAQADVDALRRILRNHPAVHYAQGLIYYTQQDYASAQIEFDRVLAQNGNQSSTLLYGAAASYAAGNREVAEEWIQKYVSREPFNPTANQLLATIKLEREDFEEAERIARRVLAQDEANLRGLDVLGTALLAQNKAEEGVRVLRELAEQMPDSAPARVRLATGLRAQDQVDAALAELESAIALDPGHDAAHIERITLLVNQGQYGAAEAAAQSYRELKPDSRTPLTLLALVHRSAGDRERELAIYEELLAQDPGNVSANSALAAYAMADGDIEGAKAYFNAALAENPGHVPTLLNLAGLAAAQQDEPALRKLLNQAIEADPSAPRPALELARLERRTGNPEAAVALLTPLVQLYPRNLELLNVYSASLMDAGNLALARANIQRVQALAPADPGTWLALAEIEQAEGNLLAARRALRRSLELRPDHEPTLAQLVRVELLRDDADAARKALDEFRAVSDNEAEEQLFAGRLSELEGDLPAALRAYSRALELRETNLNLLRVARTQVSLGNAADATAMLQGWLEEYPGDAVTKLELGTLYMFTQRLDEAIVLLREVAQARSGDPLVLNNLAWLLREEAPAEAVDYAKKAVDLAPDSPDIKDTYALVLMHAGEHDKALRWIQRALDEAGDNPSMLFHKARILNASGKTIEAHLELRTLLGRHSAFPEREAAVAMLEEISGSY